MPGGVREGIKVKGSQRKYLRACNSCVLQGCNSLYFWFPRGTPYVCALACVAPSETARFLWHLKSSKEDRNRLSACFLFFPFRIIPFPTFDSIAWMILRRKIYSVWGTPSTVVTPPMSTHEKQTWWTATGSCFAPTPLGFWQIRTGRTSASRIARTPSQAPFFRPDRNSQALPLPQEVGRCRQEMRPGLFPMERPRSPPQCGTSLPHRGGRWRPLPHRHLAGKLVGRSPSTAGPQKSSPTSRPAQLGMIVDNCSQKHCLLDTGSQVSLWPSSPTSPKLPTLRNLTLRTAPR